MNGLVSTVKLPDGTSLSLIGKNIDPEVGVLLLMSKQRSEIRPLRQYADELYALENEIMQAAEKQDQDAVGQGIGRIVLEFMMPDDFEDINRQVLIDHTLWRLFRNEFVRQPAIIIASFIDPTNPVLIQPQGVFVTVLGRFHLVDPQVREFLEKILDGSAMGLIMINPLAQFAARNALSPDREHDRTPPTRDDDAHLLRRSEVRIQADDIVAKLKQVTNFIASQKPEFDLTSNEATLIENAEDALQKAQGYINAGQIELALIELSRAESIVESVKPAKNEKEWQKARSVLLWCHGQVFFRYTRELKTHAQASEPQFELETVLDAEFAEWLKAIRFEHMHSLLLETLKPKHAIGIHRTVGLRILIDLLKQIKTAVPAEGQNLILSRLIDLAKQALEIRARKNQFQVVYMPERRHTETRQVATGTHMEDEVDDSFPTDQATEAMHGDYPPRVVGQHEVTDYDVAEVPVIDQPASLTLQEIPSRSEARVNGRLGQIHTRLTEIGTELRNLNRQLAAADMEAVQYESAVERSGSREAAKLVPGGRKAVRTAEDLSAQIAELEREEEQLQNGLVSDELQLRSEVREIEFGLPKEWLNPDGTIRADIKSRMVAVFISGGEGPGVNTYFGYDGRYLREQGLIPVAVRSGIDGFTEANLAENLLVLTEEIEETMIETGGAIPETSRINLLDPKNFAKLEQALKNMAGFAGYLAIGGGDHAVFWARFAAQVPTLKNLAPELRQVAVEVLSKMIVIGKTIDGDTVFGQPVGFRRAVEHGQEVIYGAAASAYAMRKSVPATVVGSMGATVSMLAAETGNPHPANYRLLRLGTSEDRGLANQIDMYGRNILTVTAEVPVTLEQIIEAAREIIAKYGFVVVVVPEAVDIRADDPLLLQLITEGSPEYDKAAYDAWDKYLKAGRDAHGNPKRSETAPEVIVQVALKHFLTPGKKSSVRLAEKISYGIARGPNPSIYERIYARLLARKATELVAAKQFGKVISLPWGDDAIDQALIHQYEKKALLRAEHLGRVIPAAGFASLGAFVAGMGVAFAISNFLGMLNAVLMLFFGGAVFVWFAVRMIRMELNFLRATSEHAIEDAAFEEVWAADRLQLQTFDQVYELAKEGVRNILDTKTLSELPATGVLVPEPFMEIERAYRDGRLDQAITLFTQRRHLMTTELVRYFNSLFESSYTGPITIVGKLGGTSWAFEAATPWGLMGYRIEGSSNKKEDGTDVATEDEFVAQMVKGLEKIINRYGANRVIHVYFSAPGSFHPDGYLLEDEPNIPTIKKGFNFSTRYTAELAARFPRDERLGNIPVYVDHDATAGGKGELNQILGTLEGVDATRATVLYIIAGTGVGSRMIINGVSFDGGERVNYLHNEVHPIVFNGDIAHPDFQFTALETHGYHPDFKNETLPDGSSNPLFNGEDLEDRTSGPSIARYAQARVQAILENRNTHVFAEQDIRDAEALWLAAGKKIENINTVILGRAANAAQPNLLARQMIQERARELGIGLAVDIFETHRHWPGVPFPDHIVIGSGVAKIGKIFLEAVQKGLRSRLKQYQTDGYLLPEFDVDDYVAKSVILSAIADDTAREFFGGLPTVEQSVQHQAKLDQIGVSQRSEMRTRREMLVQCAIATAAASIGLGNMGSMLLGAESAEEVEEAPVAPRNVKTGQPFLITPGGNTASIHSGSGDPDQHVRYYRMRVTVHVSSYYAMIPKIKERDPNNKWFMYRDFIMVQRDQDDPNYRYHKNHESVGGAKDAPEDWFLHKRSTGERLVLKDEFGVRWYYNPGNPEVRKWWIKKTLADVNEGGWDGVFIDNMFLALDGYRCDPRDVREYPTIQGYQLQAYRFLKEISEAFRAERKLVIANVSRSYTSAERAKAFSRLLSPIDGYTEEHFVSRWFEGDASYALKQMLVIQQAVQNEKIVVCITYHNPKNPSLMETSLAAYLVAAGGYKKGFWTYRSGDYLGQMKPGLVSDIEAYEYWAKQELRGEPNENIGYLDYNGNAVRGPIAP
ncbi:MAG: putative glycoside hydrolase, partial [Candidatus Omnitrophica bacterium]|nr:putative glycoside hydrolase [Candidatus Omnitrophota bacterium]